MTAIRSSLTIADFCRAEQISRSTFYNLERSGKGPRTYILAGVRRITPTAHDRWRQEREAETAANATKDAGLNTASAAEGRAV